MTDKKEIRQIVAEQLTSIGKNDKRIMVLEADLMGCHATKMFKDAYPDRFLNIGIAEANMIGVAAGLSAMGKVPFAFSFGPFATRRCFDQAFISVAYAKQNVKIVGSDPGVTAEANGGTHMPFEDMSLMCSIPKMVCFEPTDGAMAEKAIKQIVDFDGAVYMRMFRKAADTVYDESLDFELGKAITVKEGTDVTLFCSGIMVAKAIEASNILADEGISAEVINVHTWKPIDESAIIESVSKTGACVSCENHSTNGGLGSIIATVLAENCPAPMSFVGVKNQFGEVGKMDYLCKVFGLTVEDIVLGAKSAISKKRA